MNLQLIDQLPPIQITALETSFSIINVYIKRPEQEMNVPSMLSSESAATFLREYYEPFIDDNERFTILYLKNNNEPIALQLASIGGITGTLVDIRIVMRTALVIGATSMIACHNHPSGTLRPSISDEKLTKKLNEAGTFLDIKLMDHIILSSKGYYSFADEGQL